MKTEILVERERGNDRGRIREGQGKMGDRGGRAHRQWEQREREKGRLLLLREAGLVERVRYRQHRETAKSHVDRKTV